jgi:hypothetical protein
MTALRRRNQRHASEVLPQQFDYLRTAEIVCPNLHRSFGIHVNICA